MRLQATAITIILLCTRCLCIAQNSISLSGEWQFRIDRADIGIQDKWFNQDLSTHILLPGSMLERQQGDDVSVKTKWIGSLYDSSFFYNPYMEKYRKEGNLKLPFFLTPDKHYVGAAWYRKTVSIPASWSGKRIFLYLERPHIETEVWINGLKAGSENSLTTAHQYDLTPLIRKGENTIAIRIDNGIDKVGVGADSHSVTDQTQGDWNGIVGKIELRSTPLIYIEDMQVYPDIHSHTAKIIIKTGGGKIFQHIKLTAELFNSTHQQKITKTALLKADSSVVILPLGNDMEQWDEFHPALYRLTATLDDGAEKQTVFGMRQITVEGKMIACNGRKIMLRGTVDNCCFPLTGYPPMDEASWEKLFRKCRSYGINHVRFHSYCPPEAAFLAADIVGMYLQPEGPSWPNHGVKLGNGMVIDKYLMTETQRMVRDYGNHPSFCMLSAGNEPSGNWVKWVSRFVDEWKAADNRRIYTGASVGNGWQWQPQNMYHVKAGARGLDAWNKSQPSAADDFTENISTYKGTPITAPYISHETGQWCAFPDFDEIQQYTGVYHPGNFEIFRDLLRDHNMGTMAHHFLMSSGKLQTLCYKYEIEKILRTPDYAGFQLLGLNDYSGQGTALVGVLNVFFKEKGYCNAHDFTAFCAPVVNLARMPKFTYQNTETLTVPIEIANYSSAPLDSAVTSYLVTDDKKQTYASGTLPERAIPIGRADLGTVSVPLSDISTAAKLTLTVHTQSGSTSSQNHWDFWVYPVEEPSVSSSDIYITDTLDRRAIQTLSRGGKVLITAAGKTRYGDDIVQHYTPVFWNTSWFKMRPPHTTGAYIDNTHPVFGDFPTDDWSSLQWWELLNRATVMNFDEFPKDFQPTVQTIDTWFVSRKAGMLFEANVLKGKLLMTTIDITTHPDARIVARQLRRSILRYMEGNQFRPAFTIDISTIKDLFEKTAPPVDMFTHDSPDELKPKIN